MKQIYLKLISVCLLCLLGSKLLAYDCKVDGIYYNIKGTEAEVTSGNSNYTGAIVIPTEITYKGKTFNVTSIGDYAFNACTDLTSITIPNSVTSIGESAFSRCSGLASISIENGNSVYDSRENCNAIIETATNTLVAGCNSTVIPNSVTSIEKGAFFNCSDLTSIEIPNSVKSIGDQAFWGCTGLTSIKIPNSVENLGWGVFPGCTNLKTVYIDITNFYGPIQGPSGIFDYAEKVVFGDNVRGVHDFSFGDKLKEITIPESVLYLESGIFSNCKSLNSASIFMSTIPSSCFSNATSLEKVTLGEKVTKIDNYAFRGCTALKEIAIPDALSDIGEGAFGRCSSLLEIMLPDNVTSIGKDVFSPNSSTMIKVHRGSKTLLSLWNAECNNIYDAVNSDILPPTEILLDSSTQCSATFKVKNIYPEYTTTCNNEPLKSSQIRMVELQPEFNDTLTLCVALKDVSYNTKCSYSTKSLNLQTKCQTSSTTISVKGNYDDGDAHVIAQRIKLGDKEVEGNDVSLTGLEPSTQYKVSYSAAVAYGKKYDMKAVYTNEVTINTHDLKLKTLDPKVIVAGEIIVAAESNITNDEEKVGFEWRRTDAPDEVNSKSGEAFLYKGKMEGYIHNLTSFNYWRFRPYYESASGNRYYGDWGIIEADDYSYFEPTVHTYDNIKVDGNEAEVKGYVTRGTDEVEEQGFAYWEVNSASRSYAPQFRAASVPTGAKTIAASGQVMTAKINGLSYERTYNYVAYLKTSKGDTYYGEVQTFTTGETPSGISQTTSAKQATIVVRYDAQGRRITSPVKGLNILKMSDGTTRKVFKK